MRKIITILAVILVAMQLPITALAQSKPRITSPSDRSSSVLGNDINVYVSGNNIEVIYAGLNGNPNPSNSSESNFYKGTMYQSGNRFFFTPNTSTWENKWVKIIAHDKVGGGWSDPVYVKINPKPQSNPTPPAQPQYSTSRINDYRWTIQSATVYNDLNLSNRKTTLNKGTKVYVTEKYTYSNGKVVAKINEGYVNANDLGTAEPTPTQQNVNDYRWIIANLANVYNDWNLTNRKTTLSKGAKVYVSYKYILNNGSQVAKINEGYVNANDLGTAEPTPTQQNVNDYRWIIANPASIYNDWNLTSRKTTLSKGTKVYVSFKYILSNGNQVAKINEGYVNANDLGTAEPTPTQQNVNEYRWIIANPANVYNDWNLTSRKTTLSKGTKVYVSFKYILSNGNQVAKINEGYVNANDLGTAEPTPTQQNVNEYRWIIANPANIYNDWNLTSRKTTLSKGTKVYVSFKYILSNGNQVAKINEGYINANDLGTAEPNNQGSSLSGSNVTNTGTNINFADFARATYNQSAYNNKTSPVKGWQMIHAYKGGHWNPFVTDFWYQIYQKNNEKTIIIAFRGTPKIALNPAIAGNWKETLELIGMFGNKTGTHPQTTILKREVDRGRINYFIENDYKIYITGHSLGGHLAMICYKYILDRNRGDLVERVETFNAVGISKSDANVITSRGNSNKIRQNYASCDVARWASTANGLEFPGIPMPQNCKTSVRVLKSYNECITSLNEILKYAEKTQSRSSVVTLVKLITTFPEAKTLFDDFSNNIWPNLDFRMKAHDSY